MNRKQFRLLLVLGLVVGGVGLAAYRRNAASWNGSTSFSGSAGNTVLGTFDLNAVNRVTIKEENGTLGLVKKGDLWVVEDRGDYPADFNRIKELIRGLWELKPTQEVKAGPSQLARLDLVAPGEKKTEGAEASRAGTLVELKNGEGNPLAALLIGKRFLKKSPHLPDMEGYPAGRYVMPVTAQGGKVSLVSETLESAEAKPEKWLKKDFIRIAKVRSVIAGSPAGWKLTRESEMATEWQLDGAKPEEKLDNAKVPNFTSILGAPGFHDVLPPETKVESSQTVAVETFDGVVYRFAFGKAEGENLPVQIAITANLKKERSPGPEEKPEDKEKLDAEFAAQLKEQEEKLAKEKTLEARVYLVSKSAFEPLFKPRADLLETKETPAAEEKPEQP